MQMYDEYGGGGQQQPMMPASPQQMLGRRGALPQKPMPRMGGNFQQMLMQRGRGPGYDSSGINPAAGRNQSMGGALQQMLQKGATPMQPTGMGSAMQQMMLRKQMGQQRGALGPMPAKPAPMQRHPVGGPGGFAQKIQQMMAQRMQGGGMPNKMDPRSMAMMQRGALPMIR